MIVTLWPIMAITEFLKEYKRRWEESVRRVERVEKKEVK